MSTLFHPNCIRSAFFVFHLCFSVSLVAQNNCLSWVDLKEKKLAFPINSDDYLVEEGGGSVYAYSCDTIKRIDQSFSFHTRYGSLDFVYDDELYSFGGYGIFQFNNSIIRFYRPKGTWELVSPNHYGEFPAPRRFMVGGLGQKKLFVGPGTTQKIAPQSKKILDRVITDFWVYDFPTKHWEQLSTPSAVTSLLKEKFNYFNLGSQSYITGTQLAIYDFNEEEILIYGDYKSAVFHNALKLEDEGDTLKVYYKNEAVRLSKQHLLGPLTAKHELQLGKGANYFPYLFLILILLLLLWFYYQHDKKRNWRKSLNPHQIKIINHLQQHKGTSSFKALYGLYSNSLSHETLKGKLRKDLETIDEQYYKVYKRHFFTYGVDPLDKRMKTITLKKFKLKGQ